MAHLKAQHIAMLALGGIAVFALRGPALAINDTVFHYQTPKTGWFSIGPGAMAPENNTAASNYWIKSVDVGKAILFAPTGVCFTSGVSLPNGAKITTLTFWASSHPGGDPQGWLYRVDATDGTVETVVTKILRDNTTERKTTNAAVTDQSVATVNNQRYMYNFRFCFGSDDDGFWGARVAYTYTDAGD